MHLFARFQLISNTVRVIIVTKYMGEVCKVIVILNMKSIEKCDLITFDSLNGLNFKILTIIGTPALNTFFFFFFFFFFFYNYTCSIWKFLG